MPSAGLQVVAPGRSGSHNPLIKHRPATDMAARRRANLGRYV